jgi:hypothetical protein
VLRVVAEADRDHVGSPVLADGGDPRQAPLTSPRNERIEVELADELEALYVEAAVARREHRGDPLALIEVNRVAGEQKAMLAAVP